MSKYVKVSADTFNNLVTDAGLLAYDFDIENPATVPDEDIITATTGGVTVSCVPTYRDNASDVDNAQDGLIEFMEVQSYDCKLSTTALEVTPEVIALSIGPADVDSSTGKITPTWKLKKAHAKDIFFIAVTTGGKLAVCILRNALSSAGFVLKTTKKAKGTIALELTAHPEIATQDEVPMEFYVIESDEEEEEEETTPEVTTP